MGAIIHNDIIYGGNTEIPIASTNTLGGIKVGDGLSIDSSGILSTKSWERFIRVDDGDDDTPISFDSDDTISISYRASGKEIPLAQYKNYYNAIVFQFLRARVPWNGSVFHEYSRVIPLEGFERMEGWTYNRIPVCGDSIDVVTDVSGSTVTKKSITLYQYISWDIYGYGNDIRVKLHRSKQTENNYSTSYFTGWYPRLYGIPKQ